MLLVRIGHEVEQFPGVLFPVMDQFVRGRADAVVSPRVVVPGIVVVAVVDAPPPAGRALTPQQRGPRLLPCIVSGTGRPAGDQGHPQTGLVHESLVAEPQIAEIPAVVGRVDHDRVVGQLRLVKEVEHLADAVVHALHAGEIVLHEPLVFPAHEVIARERPAFDLQAHQFFIQPLLQFFSLEASRRLELEVTSREIAGDRLLVFGQVGRPSLEKLNTQIPGNLGAVALDRELAAGHKKFRIPIVALAGQHDPAVEAGGIRAQVPFLDHARVVATRLQSLGDMIAGAVEGVEHGHAVLVRILPGEQRGTAGRADGIRHERVREPGPDGGEPIELRSGVDLRSVAGDRVLGMIVGEDKEDVRPFRRLRGWHDRNESHLTDVAAGDVHDRLWLDAERVFAGDERCPADAPRHEGLKVPRVFDDERKRFGGSSAAGVEGHLHRAAAVALAAALQHLDLILARRSRR